MAEEDIKITDDFIIYRASILVTKPLAYKFKVNLYWVGDIIRRVINENQAQSVLPRKVLVDVAMGTLAASNEKTMIPGFIVNTYPYWQQIKDKNINFFIAHGQQLFALPGVNAEAFPTIFREKLISAEDVEKLWTYLNTMIRQSIKWLHQETEAKEMLLNEGKLKFDRTLVMELVKKFEVKL